MINENKNKNLERELQKRKYEEEEAQKYKYKPNVPINSVILAEKRRKEINRNTNKPIYEQLMDYSKIKEEKIRNLKNKEEEQYQNQFKPSINEVSNWIADQK